MRKALILILVILPLILSGQQSHTLYSMQYLPQANYLNPAVQSPCKVFIGLPLISGLHLNYANSAFSFNSVVNLSDPTAATLQLDQVIDRMGRRSIIGTELHIPLLALGYKMNDYYFNFSLTEKVNLPITLPRQLFALPWGGNTQFVDESAGTRGTSIYAIHYREYALGVSKNIDEGNFLGAKLKLLFGKAYLGFPEADVMLHTDSSIYELTLTGDVQGNLAAPIVINQDDGIPNNIGVDLVPDFTIYQYLFNRRNWGIVLDAGFIRRINSRTTISGSIVDLGFIGWRDNVSNMNFSGEFTYEGILADSVNVVGELMDLVQLDFSNENFYTMLPPKLYLGIDYALLNRLSAHALTSAVIYRTKLVSALTLSLDYNPFRNFHLIASYSLMYRSFNNLGLGISLGRGPFQLYAVTDNLTGMIWPLSSRNFNLRFGLNINLGCRKREKGEKGEQGNGQDGFYSPGYKSPSKKGRPKGLRPGGHIDCPAYSTPLDRIKRRRR